jgi:hypothetical protein
MMLKFGWKHILALESDLYKRDGQDQLNPSWNVVFLIRTIYMTF